jgi:hypothetical protein
MTTSPTSIKTAPKKLTASTKSRLGWSDVLRVVQEPKALALALSRFKGAGFTPDEFNHSKTARIMMCETLTRVEDWLEMEKPRSPDRDAVKGVRRRLELELWS